MAIDMFVEKIIQHGNIGLKSNSKSKYAMFFNWLDWRPLHIPQCFDSHEPFQIEINCLSWSGHDGNSTYHVLRLKFCRWMSRNRFTREQ